MPRHHDNPRFKRKRDKGNREVIEQREIDNVDSISKKITDDVKIEIATFLMEFSQMEMSATHFLWDVLRLNSDDGKLLVAHIDTLDKFELVKKIADRYNIPIHEDVDRAKNIWTDIRQITPARNKVAHGVWCLIDGVTAAFSYRIPGEPGRINSETFTTQRLRHLTQICKAITLLLEAMCLKAQLLYGEPEKSQS